MTEKITELIHCMWRKEAIPQEYKNAPIIHLYKRKGNPQVFENQRGIFLHCWEGTGKNSVVSPECSF